MRPVSIAVVRAGVIPKEALAELQRWGLPVETLNDVVVKAESAQQAIDIICDALDADDQTDLRESDLEVIKTWLNPDHQMEGKLQIPIDGRKSNFKVTFCRTKFGEYVIPWNSESIAEFLLTTESFLRFEENGEKKKVHFLDVRELFVGDQKAFMVCTAEEA